MTGFPSAKLTWCGSLVDARNVFDHMTERNTSSWNMRIAASRKRGLPQEALSLFHQMKRTGVPPDPFTFASILQTCAKMRALEQGIDIHQKIIESGLLSSIIVANALMDMYSKCRRIQKARQLFDKMLHRNVVSWNGMISGYTQNGDIDEALRIFKNMSQPNVVSWNAIITGYTENGVLDKALRLFNKMPQRNMVSWTTMIAGYAQNGFVEKALEFFKQMQLAGVKPDSTTFASILPACAKLGALEQGMELHQRIIESGFLPNVVVTNALIDMYAKCKSIHKAHTLFDKMFQRDAVSWNALIAGYAQIGVLEEALRIFKEMPQPNMVSWNAIIAGYVQNELDETALEIFKQMQLAGVKPDSATFASILAACAKMGALEWGIDIHLRVMESGLFSDVVVANTLIAMYAKCGITQKAHRLFGKMAQRNVVSWNAIICGYAQNRLTEKALEIFKRMQLAGMKPNSATFAGILPACAEMRALEHGMEIHRKTIESGFFSEIVVVNSLIAMYSKCGSIQKAQELFEKMPERDTVSWAAVISAYVQNGLVEKGLEIFKQMQLAGVNPNSASFASILLVCAKMGAFEEGMEIHQKVIERGFLSDVVVVTALIDMYAKIGNIKKALELFDKMHLRNIVSWNAMIVGYAQNGLVEMVLDIFKQMHLAGVKSDSSTFASILPACAKFGALEQGKQIHLKIVESGFLSDVIVANSLIDMYAKCGRLQKASKLFDKMHDPDVVSWTAMIAGYAMHGYSNDVLKFFELMKLSGTNPDHVSFVCVLFACSHAGLVDEGCRYFNLMNDSYCIMPTMDHYVCVVDLLGRAGFLEDALNFIIKMSIKPDVVWMCLLGACKSHKNIVLGEFTSTLLFELDPKNAAPYVLMSNIYAEMGRWGDVQKLRTLMKFKGIKKAPGCSWIEVHKMVHTFCVGDRLHPQLQEIHAKLEKLA